MISTSAARIASQISGETTSTWAPAACKAASFDAATGPPPTTTTRRPCNFRNAGNNAMTELLFVSPEKSKSPEGFGLPGFGYVSLRWMLFRTSTRGPKAGKACELHTTATNTRAGIPREHSVSYNVHSAVKSSAAHICSEAAAASGRNCQVQPAPNLIIVV